MTLEFEFQNLWAHSENTAIRYVEIVFNQLLYYSSMQFRFITFQTSSLVAESSQSTDKDIREKRARQVAVGVCYWKCVWYSCPLVWSCYAVLCDEVLITSKKKHLNSWSLHGSNGLFHVYNDIISSFQDWKYTAWYSNFYVLGLWSYALVLKFLESQLQNCSWVVASTPEWSGVWGFALAARPWFTYIHR